MSPRRWAHAAVKSDFLEHAADLLAEFTGIEPVPRTERFSGAPCARGVTVPP